MDQMVWLDEVNREQPELLPVAAEILLGAGDPETITQSLDAKGIRVTPADAVAAVETLVEAGFLEVVFSASSPVRDGAEEQVLHLRLPDYSPSY